MKALIPLMFATLFSSTAMADEPAKSNCTRPVIPPAIASDLVNKYYHKHVKEFDKCVAKFIDEQEAISKNSTDAAKANAAHDAADAAIKDHNEFIEEVNAREAKIGDDSDDNSQDNRKPM
jgi:hypothetical protein